MSEEVERIKKDREMEGRYMLFEELLQDERKEGREEGRAEGRAEGSINAILKILPMHGEVPDALQDKIRQEKDPSVLEFYLEQAVKASSIEEFSRLIVRK